MIHTLPHLLPKLLKFPHIALQISVNDFGDISLSPIVLLLDTMSGCRKLPS
jgi:hypothetical protein